MIRIILACLLISGCANKYPYPEVGRYSSEFMVVKTQKDLQIACSRSGQIYLSACIYDKRKPPLIIFIQDSWELNAVHELAHLFDINNHGD